MLHRTRIVACLLSRLALLPTRKPWVWLLWAIVLAWTVRSMGAETGRKWTVYLLPHPHVDIGYTHPQADVEHMHWKYFEEAIAASRRTTDYPAGARYKWNVEVLWAVDSYLKQATPEKQQKFVEAVRKGWIGLDALYANELTALCRPEELMRLIDYAGPLSDRCGVTIDSAMISDVPGYTWGLTSALAAAGVKYLSIGCNPGIRTGWTNATWEDKPFYWITPDGKNKILCWLPKAGYALVWGNNDVDKQMAMMVKYAADLERAAMPTTWCRFATVWATMPGRPPASVTR